MILGWVRRVNAPPMGVLFFRVVGDLHIIYSDQFPIVVYFKTCCLVGSAVSSVTGKAVAIKVPGE